MDEVTLHDFFSDDPPPEELSEELVPVWVTEEELSKNENGTIPMQEFEALFRLAGIRDNRRQAAWVELCGVITDERRAAQAEQLERMRDKPNQESE